MYLAKLLGGGGEEKKREFTNPMEPHHRRHKTEEGEVFYENTKTGETSWEKPSGFVEEKDEKKTSELNINICDDWKKCLNVCVYTRVLPVHVYYLVYSTRVQ